MLVRAPCLSKVSRAEVKAAAKGKHSNSQRQQNGTERGKHDDDGRMQEEGGTQ